MANAKAKIFKRKKFQAHGNLDTAKSHLLDVLQGLEYEPEHIDMYYMFVLGLMDEASKTPNTTPTDVYRDLIGNPDILDLGSRYRYLIDTMQIIIMINNTQFMINNLSI